jgi:riboflavin kinase/FMN adenylyltransferase
MQVVNDIEKIQCSGYDGIAVAIGNFDGVHLGHQALLSHFVNNCKEQKMMPVVLTFIPHPNIFFSDKNIEILLTDKDEKESKIKSVGVKAIVELAFNIELQQLTAKEFLENHILGNENIRMIHLGHDFKLGAGKEDAKSVLKELVSKRKFYISEEDPLLINGEICSSSLIRKKISKIGDVELTNELLGHKYCLSGNVIRGKGIGTKALFSTINIETKVNRLIPLHGVYITKTKVNDQIFESITNIGTAPTVTDSNQLSIETHVFHFSEDVYDSKVHIFFEKRLREEIKFESIDALKTQISIDINECKEFFRNQNGISLALIGKNISHSRSQEMYEKILKKSINYKLIDCKTIDEIPTLSELSDHYSGISITSPYKKHYLREVETAPLNLESINCIDLSKENKFATNTDSLAVQEILLNYLDQGVKSIFILGDGAMSSMTHDLCSKLGVKAKILSRRIGNIDDLADIIENDYHSLVINTCAREFQFKLLNIEDYHFWDMNYNLEHHTNLFKNTLVNFKDGSEMLEIQAKNAVSFWNLNKI